MDRITSGRPSPTGAKAGLRLSMRRANPTTSLLTALPSHTMGVAASRRLSRSKTGLRLGSPAKSSSATLASSIRSFTAERLAAHLSPRNMQVRRLRFRMRRSLTPAITLMVSGRIREAILTLSTATAVRRLSRTGPVSRQIPGSSFRILQQPRTFAIMTR